MCISVMDPCYGKVLTSVATSTLTPLAALAPSHFLFIVSWKKKAMLPSSSFLHYSIKMYPALSKKPPSHTEAGSRSAALGLICDQI